MKESIGRGVGLAALALPLVLCPSSFARQGDGDGDQARTFDPQADAGAAVEQAVALAAKKHKRVLLVWGHEQAQGNVELVQALQRGRTEAWPFYYEYEVVPIHAGPEAKANAALAERLGADLTVPLPLVTILDAAGQSLIHQQAAAWRDGAAWNAGAIGAFLTEHAVEPQDAEQVLADRLKRAKKEQKRVLVHLGAPW